MHQKWKLFIPRKKIEKKEQMLVDGDKKKENASIENNFIKKVEIKNEFEVEQEKNKNE